MILQCQASVADSTNNSLVGLNGTIVNETKYMIWLDTENGLKFVPKKGTSIRVGDRMISGSDMSGRFHERLAGP